MCVMLLLLLLLLQVECLPLFFFFFLVNIGSSSLLLYSVCVREGLLYLKYELAKILWGTDWSWASPTIPIMRYDSVCCLRCYH